MDKNMIEISATVIHETDMAIFIDDGDNEVWLPKSQLEDYPDVDETGIVTLPEWLAKDKELI